MIDDVESWRTQLVEVWLLGNEEEQERSCIQVLIKIMKQYGVRFYFLFIIMWFFVRRKEIIFSKIPWFSDWAASVDVEIVT